MVRMRNLLIVAALFAGSAFAADKKVDPTFLRRHIPDVAFAPIDIATETCHYKPLFGAGDPEATVAHGVSRYRGDHGRSRAAPAKTSTTVTRSRSTSFSKAEDGCSTGRARRAGEEARFHVPARRGSSRDQQSRRLDAAPHRRGLPLRARRPLRRPKLQIANIDDVPTQTVEGHPDYGPLPAADRRHQKHARPHRGGHLLVSLFVMEFKPGGDNAPHHHDNEEEIYLLLDGQGEMVAGGGMDGIEGRFPATPGDAYFFRLNCTVGFYNGTQGPSRILAVRSTYPRSQH